MLGDAIATLRLLYYEGRYSDPRKGLYGCGAHFDFGLITLLATDDVVGLQICKDIDAKPQVWEYVLPLKGAFIVNLRDMLERWSNCIFKSTLHRVLMNGYTPNPITEKATLRLGAEEKWLKLADNLGVCGQVFRLGGIYGPSRSAVDTLIKQEPLSVGQKMRESRQYTSRVHVDDICQALNASICRSPSRKIYNIVDDDPAPRQEVFAYAQDLIEKKWNVKLTQSPFPQREEPVGQKRVIKGEKQVSNARMKKDLGVRLLHPSFRARLESVICKIENPFSL